jgi:hypothetical protein
MENNFLETLWQETQSGLFAIILLVFVILCAGFLIFATRVIFKIKSMLIKVISLLLIWPTALAMIYGLLYSFVSEIQVNQYEDGINIEPYDSSVSKVRLAEQINSEIRKGAYYYTDSRRKENGEVKANLLDSDFILLKDYLLIITNRTTKNQHCHVVPLDEVVWAGAFPSVKKQNNETYINIDVIVFTRNTIYFVKQIKWPKAKRVSRELLHVLFGDNKREMFKFLRDEFGKKLNNYEISRELVSLYARDNSKYKQIIDSLVILYLGHDYLESEDALEEESFLDDATIEDSKLTHDETIETDLFSTEHIIEKENHKNGVYLDEEAYARINDIPNDQEFLELFWKDYIQQSVFEFIEISVLVVGFFSLPIIFTFVVKKPLRKNIYCLIGYSAIFLFFCYYFFLPALFDALENYEYKEGANIVPYYTTSSEQKIARIVNEAIKNKEYFYTDLDLFSDKEGKFNLYKSNFILLRDYLLVLTSKCHVIPIDEIAWIGPRKEVKEEYVRYGDKSYKNTNAYYNLAVFTKEHVIEVRFESHKKAENIVLGLLKVIPENIAARRKMVGSFFKENYSDYQLSSELYELYEHDKTRYHSITKSILSNNLGEN